MKTSCLTDKPRSTRGFVAMRLGSQRVNRIKRNGGHGASRPIRFDITCGKMVRRVLIALASFWGAGILALLVMSEHGSLAHAGTYWIASILATYGLLFGPIAFVVGVHGLIFGLRSEAPPFVWVWMALAFIGYFGLFVGAVGLKNWKLRAACLLIEAVCALIAAKGFGYFI